ncbi:uncharacterized protein FOMMEDRAFT_71607 [Fomitiporia mediterranea MF3/22]|uniref:uncharacterized protein n=1 Tax=Fomitiporia mediterranea (strain MF3/22) TaxID=694068 RepID=UPI00044086B1|nr:uncharacterized protein FOMMEDRAFT_71607 [Fomitiporia mediterranea MF3/22]EJD07709.1 hypothetical protein FOMMEDRAFT_71607 [Fomitiporia mediterranea MF3/22]
MEAEPAELIEFRQKWKEEVRQRTSNSSSHKSVDKSEPCSPTRPTSKTSEESKISTKPYASPSSAVTHHSHGSTHFSKSLSSAVATYRLAVLREQAGVLDEALRLYRNAFRLDSNVDKAYLKEEQRLEAAAHSKDSSHSLKQQEGASHVDGIEAVPLKESSKTVVAPQKRLETETLTRLVSTFPPDLSFAPMDESGDVLLRRVPDEVIVLILMTMDPLSIERFAMLDRKARVLSLDSAIWRFLVQRTYFPPQVPPDTTIYTLAEQYKFDYRRLFIEHPRLRLDGVYIAVCHYVRPGVNSDNVWVNVSHLITYHRYLRFLADGTVISLLANEDVEPQTIVPLLKSTLRMKGLFIGNWTLEGTTICIRDLMDPTGDNARYTFQMTLHLRSRPLGRWNRLDLTGYESINVETEEAVPFVLKHERPFWFSKVRSYAV